MSDIAAKAAGHIREAVEGLAREIGHRVGLQHSVTSSAGTAAWARMIAETHAKAVLLDYLLGDFNPIKPFRIKPHAYVPDASHYMGDCKLCGHRQDAEIHKPNCEP